MRALLAGLLLVACTGGEVSSSTGDTGPEIPDPPCHPQGEPRLDVGEGVEGWGIEDIDVACGIPPQGGAPYARFRVRVANLRLADGAQVRVELFDERDDQRIGLIDVPVGFVCANVGDNADHWVTPEVHVRFDGIDLYDLEDVPVRIEATVDGVDGAVTASGSGQLWVDDYSTAR